MKFNVLQQEYKELYQAELQRRSELNKGVRLPMSLITAFSGVLYFMLLQLKQPWIGIDFAQVLLVFIFMMLLLLATNNLVQSRMGYDYAFEPTPKQLDQYRLDLLDFYEGNEAEANAQTMEYVYISYRDGAHQNAQNNEQRSLLLYRAMQWIVYTLPIIFLFGLLQIFSVISFDQLAIDIGLKTAL